MMDYLMVVAGAVAVYAAYLAIRFAQGFFRGYREGMAEEPVIICPVCGSVNTKVMDVNEKRMFCAGCGAVWRNEDGSDCKD